MEYFSYFLAAVFLSESGLGAEDVSNIVEHFWQLGRRCNDRHLYPPNSGVGKKEKFSINMVFSHNTQRYANILKLLNEHFFSRRPLIDWAANPF